MKTYVAERLLIGLSLRYGKQVVQIASDVTPDKFIYGSDNNYSREHALIWNSIMNNIYVYKMEPTVANTEGNKEYLNRLVADLTSVHSIYEYDPNQVIVLADTIFTSGTAYQMAMLGGKMSSVAKTPENLDQFLTNYNLETWLGDIQTEFRKSYTDGKTGYKHVSVIADNLIEKWERMYAGEQLSILPCGWPTLTSGLLYPVGQLAVLHGMSGVGKTAYMLGTILGTAIGLKVYGVKGCVAINSLEMKADRLVSRMASLLAGIDMTRLLGAGERLTEEEFTRLKEWALFVGTLPIHIDDQDLTTDIMGFNLSTLHNSESGPVWQVGSDYTELFGDNESEGMEQKIATVVRNQFKMSHALNASMLVISQSTYMSTEQQRTRIAGMSGLRWSRAATQAADIIVELWNPQQMKANQVDFKLPEDGVLDENSAWLLIQKYRDGGKVGVLRIGWENSFTRFYDIENVWKTGGQMITYDYLNQIAEAKKLMDKYHTRVPEVSSVWGSEWA